MTEVHVNVRIDRSAEDVFAVLADMGQNPRLQSGMKECTWTSEPPLKLGSTYDQRAEFFVRSIVSPFEVIEFEPDRRMRIVSTSGTMPIDVTREVSPIDEQSCSASAIIKGDPPRAFRILGPLLDRMLGSRVNADYQELKTMLEA